MADIEEITLETDSLDEMTTTTVVTQMTAVIDTAIGGPGEQGEQGQQGLPGSGTTIGGYNATISDPQDGDLLEFNGGVWVNEKPEDLVDGGNF